MVAAKLGNPVWAQVFGIVQGLGAPEDTTTIVRSGPPVKVLASLAEDDDVIILGRRRWSFGPSIGRGLRRRTAAHIVRVDKPRLSTPSFLPEFDLSAEVKTAGVGLREPSTSYSTIAVPNDEVSA